MQGMLALQRTRKKVMAGRLEEQHGVAQSDERGVKECVDNV
jgi:hypothetical protein